MNLIKSCNQHIVQDPGIQKKIVLILSNIIIKTKENDLNKKGTVCRN